MTSLPIRVAIADDHPAVLIGIAHELAAVSTFSVVGAVCDSSELIALLDIAECDVVLTDYVMPEGAYGDGTALLALIRRRFPRTNIVVFTMMENPSLVQNVIELGIQCIVSKADPTHHLPQAVRAAYEGKAYLSPSIAAFQGETLVSGSRTLTRREVEVVRLFVSGQTVNEIAARLNRSKKTVSAQKMAAMKKLGLKRETELYQYAISAGLVMLETAQRN